MKNPESILD